MVLKGGNLEPQKDSIWHWLMFAGLVAMIGLAIFQSCTHR